MKDLKSKISQVINWPGKQLKKYFGEQRIERFEKEANRIWQIIVENTRKFGRWLWENIYEFLSYVTAIWLIAIPLWFYFCFFNQVIVIGKENIPKRFNVIYIKNHLALWDTFLVMIPLILRWAIFDSRFIPWNFVAQEVWFGKKSGWLRPFIGHSCRCIGVLRGSGEREPLERMAKVLANGIASIFPEGTRKKENFYKLGHFKLGFVYLALRCNSVIVPIIHRGAERIWLPIEGQYKVWPEKLFGNKILIIVGKPVESSKYQHLPEDEAILRIRDDVVAVMQEMLKHASYLYDEIWT